MRWATRPPGCQQRLSSKTPASIRRNTIDTSMLDTWDAAIVERFDAIRSSQSGEQAICTLAISRACLVNLDQTLNALRRRAQHRSADSVAGGAELTALRSAALEVAVSAYVDGVTRRQRHEASANVGYPVSGAAAKNAAIASGLAQREACNRGDFEPVPCLLAPALLTSLDEMLAQLLPERVEIGYRSPGPVAGHGELRSVVAEAAVTAWLLLRGYSAAPPPTRRGGWLTTVKYLVTRGQDRTD